MNEQQAATVWANLLAHYPRLGGDPNDPGAQIRAADWMRTIAKASQSDGERIVEHLVENHARPPTLADWHKAAREIAPRASRAGQRCIFWAQIQRAPEDPMHSRRGDVLISPGFGTQAELTGWISGHARGGDEVYPWRRDISPGGSVDVSLLEPA